MSWETAANHNMNINPPRQQSFLTEFALLLFHTPSPVLCAEKARFQIHFQWLLSEDSGSRGKRAHDSYAATDSYPGLGTARYGH